MPNAAELPETVMDLVQHSKNYINNLRKMKRKT